MKKTLLSIVTPIIFLSAISAQITQEQADALVMERMSQETQSHIIFVKDGVQTEMTITTANDEIFELDYPCFVYYIRYAEGMNDKFLIVNASNGNLLEIRTKANAEPKDLAEWQIINFPIVVPFTEYFLEFVNYFLCEWTNLSSGGKNRLVLINSNEELRNYIRCLYGYPSEVDFSNRTLLVYIVGACCNEQSYVERMLLQQLSDNKYLLSFDVEPSEFADATPLVISIWIPKISDDCQVEVNATILTR